MPSALDQRTTGADQVQRTGSLLLKDLTPPVHQSTMSSPADTPQTPPGLPPGTAPTQGPYTTSGMVPGPLPGTELDPGLHDVSAWSFYSSADDDNALPAIVSAARALVLRYRRASWLAEAIRSDAARRVALRALREVRDALAPGITADGVKAAASMVDAVANLDPATDTPVDVAGDAVAEASAALAVSAAAARP